VLLVTVLIPSVIYGDIIAGMSSYFVLIVTISFLILCLFHNTINKFRNKNGKLPANFSFYFAYLVMVALNFIPIMGLYESYHYGRKGSEFTGLAAFILPIMGNFFVLVGYIISWIIGTTMEKISISAQTANISKSQQIALLLRKKEVMVTVFLLLLLIVLFHSTIGTLLLSGLKCMGGLILSFVFWVMELC
jgi:succinate dehydrogenase hydrophobic anchor subunit